MQILRKVIKYEFLDDKKVIKGMTKQEFNAMWLPQNRPPHKDLGAKYFFLRTKVQIFLSLGANMQFWENWVSMDF